MEVNIILKKLTLSALIAISLNCLIRLLFLILFSIDIRMEMYLTLTGLTDLLANIAIALFLFVLWKNQKDIKEENQLGK